MKINLKRVNVALLLTLLLFGAEGSRSLVFGAGGGNSRRALGTVTGTVRDQHGQPLAGALVQLLRDGANEVVKQTRSAADGSFTARIAPGRYLLTAVAEGFNPTTFSAVQVHPSSELIYRFNLEPVGQGRTAPEQRSDRNDPKWRLRSTQSRRSIFQVGEDKDTVAEAVADALDKTIEQSAQDDAVALDAPANRTQPVHGVIETYANASADPLAPSFAGTNFAITAPASERLDLIFAGQLGTNSLARLETTGRLRVNDRHRISATLGGASLPLLAKPRGVNDADGQSLDQLSVRAIDEWIVRDGVVVVLGLDYSRFVGARGSAAISPRVGFQIDANRRTRLRAAYAPGGGEQARQQSVASFEDGDVIFPEINAQPVAFVDGRAMMERSQRLEFGVERVLDNKSSVEATIFFDTTDGRGLGLLSAPLNAFAGENGERLLNIANQQGAARGLRVVYARRLSRYLKTSAGYSFGRGQELAHAPASAATPRDIFRNGFFQTVAAQVDSDFDTGTHVRTVLRFSPRASVFAIDPFAGRLAVFDPSLSILVTQDLPTFGLPVRAEAMIDARNLLDTQNGVDDGDTSTFISTARRSVRGGISVRF